MDNSCGLDGCKTLSINYVLEGEMVEFVHGIYLEINISLSAMNEWIQSSL